MTKKRLAATAALLNSLTIRIKLIIAFCFLVILPLTVFSIAAYIKISNQLVEQTLATGTLAFNEAAASLNQCFMNMDIISDLILYDKEVYDIVEKYLEYSNIESQFKDYNLLINKFNYLQKTTNVDKISMYLRESFPMAREDNSIYQVSNIYDTDWYMHLTETQSNRLWFSPINKNDTHLNLSYIGVFYRSTAFSELLGILKVDIAADRLINIMDSAIITENSSIHLTDFHNTILLAGVQDYFTDADISELVNDTHDENQWFRAEINKQAFYIKYAKLDNPPWFLVVTLPERDIYYLSVKMRNDMLLILMLISTLSYMLAYMTSHSSLRRITRLTKEVRKIGTGDFDVSDITPGHDEIGLLIGSFENMVRNLSQLIEDKSKMGRDIKSAELKALQAQINPHFLYNSLDLINHIAIRNNIPQITTMVHSLSKFYKISLSGGDDIIPLADEITHASLYVQIQNMRFSDKISFEINVDEALYEFSVIKTILQPLIENSILHGILEKQDSKGKIIIRGILKNDIIILSVEDDGIGMSPDKVQNILSVAASPITSGYGVKNTNDRIRLFYGGDYGLSYTSVIGKGTLVEIKIPAIRKDEE